MIRLKVTVQSELTKLEDVSLSCPVAVNTTRALFALPALYLIVMQMVKDLSVTHAKEIQKKGAKMSAEELEARKEVCLLFVATALGS